MFEVLPRDAHNATLLAHAHPSDWQNPRTAGTYNLVAVGGGTAGIISALGAAGLGGRAALVEKHLLGGDCLNYGCVPSKALIRAARAFYDAQQLDEFGTRAAPPTIDFAAVMERMRRLRAGISHHDSAQRFAGLGVDVHLGAARFTGPDRLEVGGQTLRFTRAVVATGARAAVPAIPGLVATGYLTNETVFSLVELPRRLIVVGAGPIGCELAQAFRRFGSEVSLVQRAPTILHREDPAAAQVVLDQLRREGIQVYLGAETLEARRSGDDRLLKIRAGAETHELVADAILVGAGRQANVEDLGLEAAGVQFDARGVQIDDFLRTTNPRIYAAGDVAGSYQFTHAADAMARACLRNALFFGRARLSALVVPRCTYTDPEVAHVGLTPREAAERNLAIDSYRADLASVDRAILDGDTRGFAVVHTRRGRGQVVGATIVARHAGEMIGEVSLLMTKSLSLAALSETIHCYPTQVEVLKRIADSYQRTRLTPRVAGLFRRWLAWQR
ncbi:MAG: mercuric reductase [Pirellulales bacterium]|nr:mercuric reductase [Pirellulales bacterium]